jgi:ribosomal protein S27E
MSNLSITYHSISETKSQDLSKDLVLATSDHLTTSDQAKQDRCCWWIGEKRPVQPTTTALLGCKSGVVLPAGYEKRGALLDNILLNRQEQGDKRKEIEKKIEKIKEKREKCGKFAIKLKCKDCGNEFWIKKYCELRTCPVCAKKQSKDLFKALKELWDGVRPVVGYSFKLITLTCVRKSDLKSDAVFLLEQFNKLYHNLLECKGGGALVMLEFGKKNLQPHLHILYYGRYIEVRKLSQEWERLTGAKIVDVRRAQGLGALKEISKYVVSMSQKFCNDENILNQIELVLQNVRRMRKFGVFRKLKEMKDKVKCEYCGSVNVKYITTQEISEFIEQQIYCRKKVLQYNSS